MGNDRSRVAVHGASRVRQALVAADVIGIERRVDDPANRLLREIANRREHVVRRRRRTGVDDEHALVAHAEDDVGAAAGQHVHVARDVNGLHRAVRRDVFDAAVDINELLLRTQRGTGEEGEE